MKIDWKWKLSSRKLWAAVAGLVIAEGSVDTARAEKEGGANG